MNGSDWKLIVSTIDWFLIGLYTLIGLLLLFAKPKEGGGLFRCYTAIFCLNISIVYTLILLIARQELPDAGVFSLLLILAPAFLPLSWMLLVEALFDHKLKFDKKHYIFIIAPIAVGCCLLYMITAGGYSLEQVAHHTQDLNSGFLQMIVASNQVLFAWSFIRTIRLYRGIKDELKVLFPESVFLRWIKTWGLVIMISAIVLHTTTFIDFKPDNLFFVPMIMFHFFIWILVTFLKYPSLFTDFYISKKVIIEKSNNKVSQDIEKLNTLGENLDQEMLKNKLFLKPDIDVQTVAASMKIKVYELSMILSQVKTTNFNQYINQFRIEELINRLKTGHGINITIEALGQEVGFKSKSSFYTAFKKHTGQTPTEYIKDL